MDKQTRVLVICGGPSVEHEVSLWSAKNIVKAAKLAGFHVDILYISKNGDWNFSESYISLFSSKTSINEEILKKQQSIIAQLVIGKGIFIEDQLLNTDVAFPIIHGTYGEDGELQSILESLNIPYVGCGVKASAICIDKALTKQVAESIGIPVAKYIVAAEGQIPSFDKVASSLQIPFFVKPARLGSSAGVSKINNKKEFLTSIQHVLKLDAKILIEEAIEGKEVECAFLAGTDNSISGVGEIATTHDFYSYKAKYLDESSVKISIPAHIPNYAVDKIRSYVQLLVESIGINGMARIDFFYTDDNQIILNEINTIPGFTRFSMYPMLWEKEGYSVDSIVKILVDDAIENKCNKKEPR